MKTVLIKLICLENQKEIELLYAIYDELQSNSSKVQVLRIYNAVTDGLFLGLNPDLQQTVVTALNVVNIKHLLVEELPIDLMGFGNLNDFVRIFKDRTNPKKSARDLIMGIKSSLNIHGHSVSKLRKDASNNIKNSVYRTLDTSLQNSGINIDRLSLFINSLKKEPTTEDIHYMVETSGIALEYVCDYYRIAIGLWSKAEGELRVCSTTIPARVRYQLLKCFVMQYTILSNFNLEEMQNLIKNFYDLISRIEEEPKVNIGNELISSF